MHRFLKNAFGAVFQELPIQNLPSFCGLAPIMGPVLVTRRCRSY